ncbi:class F sortase [Streptomyces sp. NPDC002577]
MDPGRSTSNCRYAFSPSTLLLACALMAGTGLLISAVSDDRPLPPPPQPSALQAFPAWANPAPAATAPATPYSSATASAAPTAPAGSTPSHAASATRTHSAKGTAPAATPRPGVQPLPPANPVRIRIPAIGVDAALTRLSLNAAGVLQVPPPGNPGLAGWYGDGPAPGSAGTAVAIGHVDTPTGVPGVFYLLGAVRKGATIDISRADGRTAVFTVSAVELYEKKNFPSKKVYGGSGRPELRLITCGGGYTKRTGYQGNVVVYASLTALK